MAGKGKLPPRSLKPSGSSAKTPPKGPVVGYGDKGKAFHNQQKYNQSKSGQAHAANPNLSKKPVGFGAKGNAFFSPAKFEGSKAGQAAGGHLGGGGNQQPLASMPGHPSQNPTHVHGPSSTGSIKGGGFKAPRMK